MNVIIACYAISIIAWFVGVGVSYWKKSTTLMQIAAFAILFFGLIGTIINH